MSIIRRGLGIIKLGLRRVTTVTLSTIQKVFDFSMSNINARGAVSLNESGDNSQYYRLASAIVSDLPYTIALWFRCNGSDDYIWGRFSTEGGIHGDYLWCSSTTIGAYSDHRIPDIGYEYGGAEVGYTQGQWHFVVGVWHTDSLRAISIDGATFQENTTLIYNQSSMIYTLVGAHGNETVAASFLNGAIDNCGVWGRALSQEEVTYLYNNGNGLSYSQLDDSIKVDLASWHEFDGYPPVGTDSHGGNNLTAYNSPVATDGIVEGPANELDPVRSWDSNALGSIELLQDTIANRPTFRTTYIDFDGTDDQLSYDSDLLFDMISFVQFIKFSIDSLPSSGSETVIYCEEESDGSEMYRVAIDESGYVKVYLTGLSTVTSEDPVELSTVSKIAIKKNGSSLNIFME